MGTSEVTKALMTDDTGQLILAAIQAMGATNIGSLNALETTAKSSLVAAINELKGRCDTEENRLEYFKAFLFHNIPRIVPKDITEYVTDGTLWLRLNGTGGYSLYEDIYVGDYIHMSRAISAYNQDQTYQATGSDYVTIAAISWFMHNGDNSAINYEHLVMVPGKGFEGTQHFGRSRMNSTNVTTGGYKASEMHTTTLGAVASSGSTAANATINQQLKAEFGGHLKTTRELLSNAVSTTAANRLGADSGATTGFAWDDCQAVLMSEVEVYGSIVFSSSGHDTGNACAQLPLFAFSKSAQNNRTAWYWLKDVASAALFCGCDYIGNASYNSASYASRYVRPRFILAAA